MFEKATRKGLRFTTSKGQASVEDLWKMSLTSNNDFNLDQVAKKIAKRIRDEESESFVGTKKESNDDQLRLDIVKHIIKYKMDTQQSYIKRQETKARNGQLAQLIVSKTNENLSNLSIDELKAMMKT